MLLLVASTVIGSLAFAQGARHEFRLEYREAIDWSKGEGGLVPESLPVLWDSAAVSRPELGEGRMLSGLVRTGPDSHLALAWCEERLLLHADLNHNGDLSDDLPLEVVRDDAGRLPLLFLHVSPVSGAGTGKARIDLIPSAQEGKGWAAARITSGWEGEVEFDNRRWRLSAFGDLDGNFTGPEDAISLRLLDEEAVATGVFKVPPQLGLGGRLYNFSLRFKEGGEGDVVVASFEECTIPTKPCEFRADDLACAVFQRFQGHEPTLAIVVHRPSGAIPFPIGTYRGLSKHDLVDHPSPLLIHDFLQVNPDKKAIWHSPGPFRHDLEVTRSGARSLDVEYALLRGDGWAYDEYDFGRVLSEVPTFSVYRGREKIASGEFRPG